MRSVDTTKYDASDIAYLQNVMAYGYILLEEPFTYYQFETFTQRMQQVESLLKQQEKIEKDTTMLMNPTNQTEAWTTGKTQPAKTTAKTGDITKTVGCGIALLLSGCFMILRKKKIIT